MYRINILTSGKFHNVITGYRYFFTKKMVKKAYKEVYCNWECECILEKFIRCTKGWYAWSEIDSLTSDKWEKFFDECDNIVYTIEEEM